MTSSAYTKVCSKPYDSSKPLVQYVLMIDAGSTGSRIHVYKFHNCYESPTLEHETFEQIKPGLSSYANSPQKAAESLDALLDIAVAEIPKELQSCTPLAVKATAGLRLLGEEQAQAILDAVEQRIHEKYPFPLQHRDGVIIMEGKDEGVYAWITTNYLLGNYSHRVILLIPGNIGGHERKSTAAVFDLGGGSTQIVFEPEFSVPANKLAPGDHEYILTFAGHTYTLYQHSHLGYGLMEARKSIHNHIHRSAYTESNVDIINPCLPPHMSKEVDLHGAKVRMVGPTHASPLQCRAIAETILNKTAPCALVPCAFNGIYMPKLSEAFPATNDVYLFSYFYDRTQPLGVPTSFSLHELRYLTQQICSGQDAWDAFEAIPGAMKALSEIGPEWCLDLNFMDALLVTGYEFHLERGVKSVKKVNGNEVGWCLGASLPLLERKGWECKLEEVF